MRIVVSLLALAAAPTVALTQIARVEITPGHTSVTAGETVQFRAVARDSAGRELQGVPLIWTATPFDIAGIDSTGVLRTFRQGKASVFAIAGGRPAVATVEIGPKPPATVQLVAPQAEIVVGGTTVLTAVPRTTDGVPRRDVPVTFRGNNERIATVDAGGVVVGRAPGTVQIFAQAGDAMGQAAIKITSNPVSELILTGGRTARTGDVVRLSAQGRSAAGRLLANPPVRWSVTGPGASVYPDGAFVAERAGTYVVTAAAGDVVATHAVAVTPRTHARRFEQVTHLSFSHMQATELWAVNDALYVATVGDRVYSFDISDPARPVKTDSIVVDAHVVNDVSTTPDGRIGVMTREGASSRGNGLVFLDLADPLRPKVLSEYTATVTGGVHSAFIDGHYVYATDDATGSLRVISFEDPERPREVARWEIAEDNLLHTDVMGMQMTSGRMLHDVQVLDGIAYLAYWRHGLVILDVGAGIKGGSPEDPKLVSRFLYNHADLYPPDMLAGTHAVFRYKNYLFLGDEVFPGMFNIASRERIKSLGRVHVLDVSDLERPEKVAEYNVQDMGSHNMWVADDVMYIGYYEGGVRAVDVSGELRGDLMAQGREIGAVWTGSLHGFRPNVPMAWGAQPHKGHVFASDMNTGLWVMRLTTPPVP